MPVQQLPELSLLAADICRGLNILSFGRQTHFSNSSGLDCRHVLSSATEPPQSGQVHLELFHRVTMVWQKST